MAKKFTTLDYCQYLLSSQINYTITNLAKHVEEHSHDNSQHKVVYLNQSLVS